MQELFGLNAASSLVAHTEFDGDPAVAQLSRAIGFEVDGVRHAIFLAVSTRAVEGGVLATCHACGATLSYAVFRTSQDIVARQKASRSAIYGAPSGWDLVALERHAADLGVFGEIPLEKSEQSDPVALHLGTSPHLIMLVETGYTGQGETSVGQNVFLIDLSAGRSQQSYKGHVWTAGENCGSLPEDDEDGNPKDDLEPDYKGELRVDASVFPPVFRVEERYFKNCQETPSGHPPVLKTYRLMGDEYRAD
jgi:hypothetical protein